MQLQVKIDVSYFLKMCESLSSIVREVYLRFSKKGMTIQSMDPAKIAFVSLFLEKDGFDSYKCPKAIKCGVSLEYLHNILRLSKSPLDKLTLSVDETDKPKSGTQTQGDPGKMRVLLEDEKSGRETEFLMKLVSFDEPDFNVPKIKSRSLLCMRSGDFTRICRDLENISESVTLSFVKKGINLSVKSDIADGHITIQDNDTMEESKSTTEKEKLSEVETGTKNVLQILSQMSLNDPGNEYSLKYLNIFNKGSTFSPIIKIHMPGGKEAKEPMLMEFKIDEIGEMKYFLSHKIQE